MVQKALFGISWGYTYLDADRDFGRINKVLWKHASIFDLNQYRKILKACTKDSTIKKMEQYFRDVYSFAYRIGPVNKKKRRT